MSEIEELKAVIKRLRAKDGCPWDREQTHASLKPGCIEEACEVICGINIYEETGNADNMLEELGDLLLQIVMQAEIADEQGLMGTTISSPAYMVAPLPTDIVPFICRT